MTTRSYSDLSDSATTFDPEEQFDRGIDERMKGMTKEEAVAKSLCYGMYGHEKYNALHEDSKDELRFCARAAIAAADKWDAEQRQPAISAGQDAAIQDELDHPPASIMEEGK